MTEHKRVALQGYMLAASVVAGAAVLGLEVLAARAMAPAIGSGSVAWASLLAVALGTLAAGNLIGGFLADRASALGILAWSLPAAAAAAIGISRLYPPAMRWAGGAPLIWGALAAAAVTQFVPMLLLGVISPAIITAGRHAGPGGRWAGAVLASGSAGGIAGALVMGLVSLPALGISRSYLATAVLLAIAAVPAVVIQRRRLAGLFALATLLAALAFWLTGGRPGVIQSRYGQIEVRRGDREAMTLLIDGLPQTAIRGPIEQWEGLRHGYLMEVAVTLADGPRYALVIGLGAGLATRLLEAHGCECWSVEIDPAVVEVARREFNFDGAVAIDDGRSFLRREPTEWDIIVVDVCTADRLPAHLFTVEALRLMQRRLSPGGVLAMQFIGDDGPWSDSLVMTVREVFGECLALAPAADLAPVGPRWIFAGPALPPVELFEEDAEASGLWRRLRPGIRGRLLSDDHFGAELDWARTARVWRAIYARSR